MDRDTGPPWLMASTSGYEERNDRQETDGAKASSRFLAPWFELLATSARVLKTSECYDRALQQRTLQYVHRTDVYRIKKIL
jgi:hypothetical protein